MILVTLGTHGRPMDRLLRALDELLASAAIAGPVLVQAGAIGYRPEHAQIIGIVRPRRLAELMSQADVVITHGGPGSIFGALAEGRIPVVVPRQSSAGEHVDDHQIRFATWLATRREIITVLDVGDLAGAIDAARSRSRSPGVVGPAPETVRRVAELLDS